MFGLPFDVEAPEVDETMLPGESPNEYVVRLARAKATVSAAVGVVALGADTAVVHEGDVLGKPGHPAEAEAMLARLSGRVHHVVTGVAVAVALDAEVEVESVTETARVRFAELTAPEIAAYVATGEPLDKAGAYALQGRGGLLVAWIEGHPSTVVGLPLPATRRLLGRCGFPV